MRFNLPANPKAFKRIAEIFGQQVSGTSDPEAARLSIVAVEQLLDSIGVAHRLRDYGLRREDIPKVVELSWSQIDDFLGSNARLRQAGRRQHTRRCLLSTVFGRIAEVGRQGVGLGLDCLRKPAPFLEPEAPVGATSAIAATTAPNWSRIGAATAQVPMSRSSMSKATPLRAICFSSVASASGSVMVFGVNCA